VCVAIRIAGGAVIAVVVVIDTTRVAGIVEHGCHCSRLRCHCSWRCHKVAGVAVRTAGKAGIAAGITVIVVA
jgi:hypothetical protein